MTTTPNSGRFVKGAEPWNKGKTGYMSANATSFKKGNIPPQIKPKGTITRHINKGMPEYTINIDWKGNRKVHNNYKWYLWEKHNKTDRPANMVLYVINQDPDDIRVDNLEVISRGELLRRNA